MGSKKPSALDKHQNCWLLLRAEHAAGSAGATVLALISVSMALDGLQLLFLTQLPPKKWQDKCKPFCLPFCLPRFEAGVLVPLRARVSPH